MSTDLKKLMRRQEMIARICNDPDLSSDAKLFAVCSLVFLDEKEASASARMAKRNRWLQSVAVMGRGNGDRDRSSYWIRQVIRNDIPQYFPPLALAYHRGEHFRRTCTAPMIRREGLCGKPAHQSGDTRDPLTGEGEYYGYCTRHWGHDVRHEIEVRRREWFANGEPSPPPNAGGVLKKYFDTDWPGLYEWAAPYVKPLEGAKEPTMPRPRLTLIQGEGAE